MVVLTPSTTNSANARRMQGQMQRRGPAIDRRAVADIAVVREALLEGSDLRPQHELRAFDSARDRRIDLWFDLEVLSFQIQEWYQGLYPRVSAPGRPPAN